MITHDLVGKTYIPAATLQQWARTARTERVHLVNVSPEVLAQLELSRLNLVFEIDGFNRVDHTYEIDLPRAPSLDTWGTIAAVGSILVLWAGIFIYCLINNW